MLVARRYTDDLTRNPAQHITGGDYMSVFFVSRSMGWVSLRELPLPQPRLSVFLPACFRTPIVASPSLLTPPATAPLLPQAVGGSCFECLPYLWGTITSVPNNLGTSPLRSAMTYGMLLVTTNGGTVWRNKPLFFTWDTAYHTVMVNDNKLITNLYSQKIPGFLFDVQSDGSGKHVYAVGANRYSMASLGASPTYSVTWKMEAVPTIMYSGDRGNTWCARALLRLFSSACAPLPRHPRQRIKGSAQPAQLLLDPTRNSAVCLPC